MKKIIVLLILTLLVGCTKDDLETIEVNRNHYATTFDTVAIGVAENGLYYIKDEILYYKDDNEDAISLGSVNYVDGEKKQTENNAYTSNIRMDMFTGRDLICYGDRIYMEYQTIGHDMSSYYQLASVDLRGEDFKTHIIFDYMPQRVMINNGKIYVLYIDFEMNREYIETYNHNFQLISTEYCEEGQSVLKAYIENDEIIVPDEFVIYENDNTKISYKIENLYSDENRKTIGNIQIGEKSFTFENKLVLFVNDHYFYTSSCTYPQTYERYHLNGELDKSIVISEYIESEDNESHLLETDFSYIIKLKDENIAYGHSREHIFEVNFDEGTCNYVDE